MIKRFIAVSFFIAVPLMWSINAQNMLYYNEFPLGDVTLLDGPFKRAEDLNVKVLMKYTVDRLLVSYRKDAGLSTLGKSDYENWDGLNGHVLGHYLSAMAMEWAATGNDSCKKRMDYIVAELKKCQDANGVDPLFVGYVSGIPNGKAMWRKINGGNPGATYDNWAPWYNIHKTYAGLRDAYVYGKNDTAKTVFLKLCDWGIKLCAPLSDAQMEQMMGNEYGGMNEVYADAYQITNDTKYLTFAKRFSHKWLLDPMAQGRDMLDNVHANTQVPKAIGFLRISELAKDDYYRKAADFFWTTVTTNRSICIGGNSENEIFPTANDFLKRYITERNGVETCNSYNMLKLSEGLFRVKPDAKYTDFYERTLFNHILSSQNPTHGGYVYFTPTHPQHYRVYSAPDVAMWCCVGSGMENHTKYGQFIYTHSNDSLFVNLFIASQVNWKDKGITIKQETQFPDEEQTKLTISVTSPTAFKLYIRHPYWVKTGEMAIAVGNQIYGQQSQPTSYVEINRTWNNGDVVVVLLPMHFSYESLNHAESWCALKRGPIVLGTKTDSSLANMPGLVADASRFGHCPGGSLLDSNSAPKLKLNTVSLDPYFKPVAGKPLTYTAPKIFQNSADTNRILQPFFRIHNSRYMMYWKTSFFTDYTDIQKIALNEPACQRIYQTQGAIKFTFTTADPSRHVQLFTLTGKRVADITAPNKSFDFLYNKPGMNMNSGIYTVRVVGKDMCIAEKICISK